MGVGGLYGEFRCVSPAPARTAFARRGGFCYHEGMKRTAFSLLLLSAACLCAHAESFVEITGTRVKIYFTFGDHPQFPFGRDDYVVAEGLDKKDAIAKFRRRHPDVNDGLLNCAFYYDENEFRDICEKYYAGKKPAEVIV